MGRQVFHRNSGAPYPRVNFQETSIQGVVIVDQNRHTDERGYFARSFCTDEFSDHGLDPVVAQCNVSFNPQVGTLRGMHYQAEPHGEAKLVRCTRGAIFDVAVDLRPDSPTFRSWFGAELTEDNGRALYIPAKLAHGFLTLAPDSEVFYQMSYPYVPGTERGVRWNDPVFGIVWPAAVATMSDRDRNFPDFKP